MSIQKSKVVVLLTSFVVTLALLHPEERFTSTTDEIKAQTVQDEYQQQAAIEVPESGLDINGTTLNGITKKWFRENCKDNNSGDPARLTIRIPAGVKEIGTNAFSTSKANGDSSDSYTYIHPSNYKIVSADFTEASTLERIASQAFSGNSELQGIITLPESLRYIEKSAFRDCSSLQGVYLPDGLLELGSASGGTVFGQCVKLEFVRVSGSDSIDSIELPSALESIGRDVFNGAMMSAQATPITISEHIQFIGIDAFKTPAVTTITLMADDVSNYNGKAFEAYNSDDYGLGKRITIFKDYDVRKGFAATGLQVYQKSLTFEFTLTYGDTGLTEQKLNNQPLRCQKNEAGIWQVNADYILPEAPSGDREGYIGGWVYAGKLLTPDTVLTAAGNTISLQPDEVLTEPEVQFEVDGEVREHEGSRLVLDLSNDKEHRIGVKASHPLEGNDDATGYVEFAYKWTDIWSNGSYFYEEGPRMKEPEFGSIILGGSTIPVFGPTHERSDSGGYSEVDYGNGYYLVEIYGYFVKDGKRSLFYKSASSAFGSGGSTTNTAYTFNVLTSKPAAIPDVEIEPVEDTHGYEDVKLDANIKPKEGHTYSFQWYCGNMKGQIKDGIPIEGATDSTLTVEAGKPAGTYYYYLEVTSKKIENGDIVKTAVPVTFTVHKAESTVHIESDMNKVYDGDPVDVPDKVTVNGSGNEATFTWYEKENDKWMELDAAPVQAGEYKVKASVDTDMNYLEASAEKEFTIAKASNRWIQEPEIKGWVYREFHEGPSAEAEFGEVKYSYSKDKEGTYTTEIPGTAGTWYMKASVADTADYEGVESIKQFTIEKAIPLYVIPAGLTIQEGEKLQSLPLPAGFSWSDTEQIAEAAGDQTFKAVYTPEDLENYNVIKDVRIPVYVKTKQEAERDKGKDQSSAAENSNGSQGNVKKQDTALKTGDMTNTSLWIVLLGISSGLLLKSRYKKKHS